MEKKFRFYFHYNRLNHQIAVYFKGKCYFTKNMECLQPTESKWNTTQPYLTIQGWSEEILVEKDKITIL